MDNIHVLKETTLTVEKKSLVPVLPYLSSIALQTRTKLKKSLKDILNCCKLQTVFKNETRLGYSFDFKEWIPKDLTSGVLCGLCNNERQTIFEKEHYIGTIIPIRQALILKALLELYWL